MTDKCSSYMRNDLTFCIIFFSVFFFSQDPEIDGCNYVTKKVLVYL